MEQNNYDKNSSDLKRAEEAENINLISESSEKEEKYGVMGSIYDIVSVFVSAIVAIMVVFTFVFRFVGVSGESMIPTLQDGDWLAVSAFHHAPEAGDIIIITQPNYFNEPIVKRIVATEGQEIDIIDGFVYVDGERLNEPYLDDYVRTWEEDIDLPVTVKKDHVFVMGDNRGGSTDSRSTKVGQIDENYILGEVKFRILPFGSWEVE